MNIEVGQAFKYYDRFHNVSYGVVLEVRKDDLMVVPVFNVDEQMMEMKSYDEAGAKYDRDRNNVRLNSCPPPFSLFFEQDNNPDKSKAMAIASRALIRSMEKSVFLKRGHILDNGVKLDSSDMRRIIDHPFPQQKELEKTRSKADRATAALGHIRKEDDSLSIEYNCY